MKVKHVLMIVAVLLAMFVVPAAASSQITTVSYSSDAEFVIIYPGEGVPLDTGSATGEAGIEMTTIDPGSTVNLYISSGGDGFVLKHAYAPETYTLPYTISIDSVNLDENAIVIPADAGVAGPQVKSLSFSVDTSSLQAAGSYGDILTFTAEYVTPYVRSQAEAQAALDTAAPGTTIRLAPGVNYDTLVFRQNAQSAVVDITDAGGDAAGNEHYSRYEDITIIGAEGAIVDQIDFEVGWIAGSGANYVDIKNLKVQGVTFSGEKTAFNLEGSKGGALGIDGLTIEDCKMTDDGDDRFVFQQISGYKTLNDKTDSAYVMTTGVKNLKITGCEVTGAYMVIESRAMENLTITNNVFKGIKQRDMLITSDTTNHGDKTYTGTITIIGNTADSSEERFIRASLNDCDADVVITGNIITNYKGADEDYIKVEGVGTGTLTISGNSATAADSSRTLTTIPAQP